MTTIETPTVTATILNDHIVIVKARAGVEINRESATEANRMISENMPGDYGQIIDREQDYSIAPVEVYQVLNEVPGLKAIAIVVHRQSSIKTAEIGKSIYRGHFAVFTDIQDARDWLEAVLKDPDPT